MQNLWVPLEISSDFPQSLTLGNLLEVRKSDVEDGFPNTSLVLVKHGYSVHPKQMKLLLEEKSWDCHLEDSFHLIHMIHQFHLLIKSK